MKNCTSCFKSGGGALQCPSCKHSAIKHGKSAAGNQRFKCKFCFKSFQYSYTNQACGLKINQQIVSLVKEGCGIRSIGRLLQISVVTVIARIRRIAKLISKPPVLTGQSYEVDELCTFVKHKHNKIWVVAALQKQTGKIIDFVVGKRNNQTLRIVIKTLVLSNARSICTDKLINYLSVIPVALHNTKRFGTNKIERMNLNLRTHLRRLTRRTICFSKSMSMLESCLKIYCWG